MTRKRIVSSGFTPPRAAAKRLGRASEPEGTFQLVAGLVVIDGERAVDFAAFQSNLVKRATPDDPLASFLLNHLATILWRLRRSAGLEAGLWTWIAHQQASAHDRTGLRIGSHFFPGDPRGLSVRAGNGRSEPCRRRTGRMVEAAVRKADLLGRLGRYEAHLMRQAERTLAELRRMGVELHAPDSATSVSARSLSDTAS